MSAEIKYVVTLHYTLTRDGVEIVRRFRNVDRYMDYCTKVQRRGGTVLKSVYEDNQGARLSVYHKEVIK